MCLGCGCRYVSEEIGLGGRLEKEGNWRREKEGEMGKVFERQERYEEREEGFSSMRHATHRRSSKSCIFQKLQ